MKIKQFLLTVCLTSVVEFSCAKSKIVFRHGRHRDGFLGLPGRQTEHVGDGINEHVQVRWITQQLDHFSVDDERTWQQMYWVNDQFYKPGGPAFIQIGGEGPTSRHWIDTNEGTPDWLKNAEKFGAICFQLEHRYYGQSHPTPDTSVENLQWLTSQQALADVASFIQQATVLYGLEGAKWVTFGGSYSGALSAWFRKVYPELVVGAIATSGPVHAQVDFREYLGVVRDSLASYSPQCVANIANATQTVTQLLSAPTGIATLKDKLNLCDPIDPANSNDVANFYSNLAGTFMFVVQYSKDNRGSSANDATIDHVCDMMLDASIPDIFERYAAVQKWYLDLNGEPCFSFSYNDMIAELSNSSYSVDDPSGRLWTYQTCNEFGYYQGSDLADQPFGNYFPLSFSLQQCIDIFGSQFTSDAIYRSVADTNAYYGGRDLQATHVVLPNGSIDPWHALGILESADPLAPAVYINGTAHCANMYPARLEDLPELNYARDVITRNLAVWLT